MTQNGDQILEGLSEAASIITTGEPEAFITLNGYVYVLKEKLDESLRRFDERNMAAIERAGRSARSTARCAELESEFADCRIALDQARESNRERQAEIDRLRAEMDRLKRGVMGAAMFAKPNATISKIRAEIERLRPHYRSNSPLDHGRRQILDHFEKVLTGEVQRHD